DMKRKLLLAVLGVGALVHIASAQGSYVVNIEAPSAIRALLEKYLEIERWQSNTEVSPEQLQHLTESTPAEVTNLLATQGYFTPRVSTKRDNRLGTPTVTIYVEPGPETTVNTFNINITGTVTKDASLSQYKKDIRRVW